VLAKNVIVSDIVGTAMSKRKPPHGYRPSRPGASGTWTGQGGRDGRGGTAAAGEIWLYGVHPVLAALANPARRCHRLLLSNDAGRRHGDALAAAMARRGGTAIEPETALPNALDQVLPAGAVHQGLALLTAPLPGPDLAGILANAPDEGAIRRLIVVLDQVTDPQNVGAILRSAAAFGAEAVLAPGHHAAPETGALAKAASGALEIVPYAQVGNLARCLADLKAAGFWCLGLTGDAPQTLAKADPGGPLALVLGAEGSGLRRLTRESCDVLARLPTREPITNLNVSTATAVALYQLLAVAGARG
jgi:23S rRNA (guanosine2251-2'-O)-methyltransferase